mgnify:FL=1
MELTFIQSNLGSYLIVEAEGKKYIMDTSTMVGKQYYLGLLPREIIVNMVEIDIHNKNFDSTAKINSSMFLVVLLVQPFVKFIYDFFRRIFIQYDISQQIPFKLVLFAVSMLLTFFITLLYRNKSRAVANSRIPKNSTAYKVTFKSAGKRDFSLYYIISIVVACLIFYLSINNGTEGAILIVGGIVAFFFFLGLFAMPAIGQSYTLNHISLEKVEEIRE